VTFENYINKLYISLLGRKFTDIEFSNGLNNLEAEELSIDSGEASI
jgi:hypothetical protein